jgi:hypothetical protein
MSGENELVEALRRAGTRAAYHLLKAGVEGLKALEAVIDELGHMGRERPPDDARRERIDVE